MIYYSPEIEFISSLRTYLSFPIDDPRAVEQVVCIDQPRVLASTGAIQGLTAFRS